MYQFVAAQQTSTTKLPAFFQKFKKTMRALSVNETKFTSRNTFIDNLFPLEGEKESRNDKKLPAFFFLNLKKQCVL